MLKLSSSRYVAGGFKPTKATTNTTQRGSETDLCSNNSGLETIGSNGDFKGSKRQHLSQNVLVSAAQSQLSPMTSQHLEAMEGCHSTTSTTDTSYLSEKSVQYGVNSGVTNHVSSRMQSTYSHPSPQNFQDLLSSFSQICPNTSQAVSVESQQKKKTRRGGRQHRKTKGDTQSSEEDQKEKIKYKTELCKNWIEKGKCSYSVRCRFAHGHHELVASKPTEVKQQAVKKYDCKHFHGEKVCSYGIRCIHKHDERTCEEINTSYFSKGLQLLSLKQSSPTKTRSRLNVFKNLTARRASCSSQSEFENQKDLTSEDSFKLAPDSDNLSCASDSTDTAESSSDTRQMVTIC